MQPRTTAFGGWVKRGALALTALLLLAGLAGCAQRPAKFPTGTYTMTVSEEDVKANANLGSFTGTWTETFRDDGTMSTLQRDVEIMNGTYRVNGDTISWVEQGGIYALQGKDGNPTYRWSVERDGSLRLSAVDEPVADRKTLHELHPWVPAP